jgi:hypothetical protein
MNKLKAATIHLFISFIIVTSLFLVVFYIWYPKPFFDISNTIEPLKLLILIDVIIGPLLTFIVYKKNKSTLVMDLSIIALLQIAAFLYGAYIIANGRPVLLVFNNGEFHYLVSKYIDEEKIKDDSFNPSTFSQPKYASLETLDALDIYNSISNLKKLDINNNTIKASSLTTENMLAMFSKKANEIKQLEEDYKSEDILFLQLDKDQAKYYVVFSQKQQKILNKVNF